jgi:hypothetical protein
VKLFTPIYLLFLLLAPTAVGQQLLVELSQDNILVGESTILKYTVKMDAGDSIFFRNKQGEIEARMIMENGGLTVDTTQLEIIFPFQDTIVFNGVNKKWKGEYSITAWDSGLFLIPGAEILINDSTFRFKDIMLECNLVPKDSTIGLYEIREGYADIPSKPFSFSEFFRKHWWWMTIILLALIIVYIVIRKRKLASEDDYIDEDRPLSLKERTILAINALDKEELWTKDKLKEHFSELSYILRSYLTSRYQISLLEKTTYETKILLTQQGLNEETVETIARILSQSDMVKFAKSKPDLIAIVRQSTLAKQIIAETSPLDFDNVD